MHIADTIELLCVS